jgi:heme-degrading monooxygenase HmoA
MEMPTRRKQFKNTEAGCRSGKILCSEDDPSRVTVLLEWPSKDTHLNWRHANGPELPRRCRRLAGQPSEGGNYVAEDI